MPKDRASPPKKKDVLSEGRVDTERDKTYREENGKRVANARIREDVAASVAVARSREDDTSEDDGEGKGWPPHRRFSEEARKEGEPKSDSDRSAEAWKDDSSSANGIYGQASGDPSCLSVAAMPNAINRKRTRDPDSDESEHHPTPQELAKMSRSERKRHREKKRRSDVNKGFDDLMNLLLEIDPEVRAEAEDRARRGQWKGALGAHEDNLLSRVDLISRTVKVLERVHRENEQRKTIIDDFTRDAQTRATADQVSLLLPLLSPSVSLPANAASGNAADAAQLLSTASLAQSRQAAGLLSNSAIAGLPLIGTTSTPGDILGLGGQTLQELAQRIHPSVAAIAANRGTVGAFPANYIQFIQENRDAVTAMMNRPGSSRRNGQQNDRGTLPRIDKGRFI